jgi:AcrR family transcriptional regulator
MGLRSSSLRANKATATRLALLTAARRLFAERGYHAMGTPEIVSAAGVSRGAMYHHFQDKEQLFEEVFKAVAQDLETAATASVSALAEDPWRQMQEGLQSFLRIVAGSHEIQRVILIDGPAVLGWSAWRRLESEYTSVHLAQSFDRMMDLELIERRSSDTLAQLVVAALNDAAMVIANATDPQATLPEVGDALNALVSGLRVRPAEAGAYERRIAAGSAKGEFASRQP